jgi:hypothetical protein
MTGLRFAFTLLVVSGCAADTSATGEDPLVVAVDRIPQWLAPLARLSTPEERFLIRLVYAGLYEPVYEAGAAAIVPGLASGLPQPVDETLTYYHVTLASTATWHDTRPFEAGDVVYSWNVLMDTRNEYGDRAFLSRLVRRITSAGNGAVRVVLSRPILPQDVAGLLSFPIMPRVIDGRLADRLIHPDSIRATGEPSVPGAGRFRVDGPLDGSDLLQLRSTDGTTLILRAFTSRDERSRAVQSGEVDLVLAVDSALAAVWPGGGTVVPAAPVTTALVLNPDQPTLGSIDRRRVVSASLLEAFRDCSPTTAHRLPRAEFTVSFPQSRGGLREFAARLGMAVRCLKSELVTNSTAGTPRSPLTLDAAVVILGEEPSDIAEVLDIVGPTRAAAARQVKRLYEAWSNSGERERRMLLRDSVIRLLQAQELIVLLETRPQGFTSGPGVQGLSMLPDGTFDLRRLSRRTQRP